MSTYDHCPCFQTQVAAVVGPPFTGEAHLQTKRPSSTSTSSTARTAEWRQRGQRKKRQQQQGLMGRGRARRSRCPPLVPSLHWRRCHYNKAWTKIKNVSSLCQPIKNCQSSVLNVFELWLLFRPIFSTEEKTVDEAICQ